MQLTLVGVSFRPKEAKEIVAGLNEGDEVRLIRDPENKYDPNAIQVHVEDEFIGFVAKHEAAVIAPDLDEALSDDPEAVFTATVEAKPSRWSAILEYTGPGSDA